MIVELVGLPGSGKSSAEKLLRTEFAADGFSVVDPDEVLHALMRAGGGTPTTLRAKIGTSYPARGLRYAVYRLQVLARNMGNRSETSGGLLGASKKTQRDPCRWLAEDMVLMGYFDRTLKNRLPAPAVYLSSEGLVHHRAALAAWTSAEFMRFGERWLEARGSEDITVIHIAVPTDVAVGRFLERGAPRSWPDHIATNPVAVESMIQRFADAIDDSIELLEVAGARVLHVDNSGSLDELSRQISEHAGVLTSGTPRTESTPTSVASPREATCVPAAD